MTGRLDAIRQQGGRLVDWLTQPHARVAGEQNRRTARFVACVTLATALIVLILYLVLAPRVPHSTDRVLAITMALAFTLYGLSRTPYYAVSQHSLAGLVLLMGILVTAFNPSSQTLVVLVFPMYISSVLHRFRSVVFWVTVCFISAFLMERFLPGQWDANDWTIYYLIALAAGFLVNKFLLTRSDSQLAQRTRQLADSEARYRMLADNAQDVIWTIDLNGHFTYISPAVEALRGYTPQEVMRQSLADAFTAGSLETIQRELRQVKQQQSEHADLKGKHNRLEIEQPRKDGSTVWTELITSPMLDQYQDISGLLGVTRDITDRRTAEQRALEVAVEQKKRQLLEEFIGHASHDFKTPLSVLKLQPYLQTRQLGILTDSLRKLRAAPPGVEPASYMTWLAGADGALTALGKSVDNLDQNTLRLERLVNSLLEMTMLDQKTQFSFAWCDVNSIVGDVVNYCQPLAENKSIVLRFVPMPDLPKVILAPGEFSRAMQCLLDNAVMYTPDAGRITVQIGQQGTFVSIEISDTGIGIPANDQPYIFDRFYRVDKARRMNTGGSGLGLAIVRRVIEAHGGTICVTSEVDKGSTFCVLLPLLTRMPNDAVDAESETGSGIPVK